MAEKFWLDPSYSVVNESPFPLKFSTLYEDSIVGAVVVVAFGILFGIMLIDISSWSLVPTIQNLTGVRTTATIIGCELIPIRSSGLLNFTIRFPLGNGTIIEGQSVIRVDPLNPIDCSNFPNGTPLQISYTPNRPSTPEIVDTVFGDPWLRNWGLCCAVTFLLVACLIALWFGVRGVVRWVQAAVKYPQLCYPKYYVYGEISQYTGKTQGRKNERYFLTVGYIAQAPDGEWIFGKQRARRDDLLNTPIPEPGTPITVLYHSKRVHCML